MPVRNTTPSLFHPDRLVKVTQTDSVDWNPGALAKQVIMATKKVATDRATMYKRLADVIELLEAGYTCRRS